MFLQDASQAEPSQALLRSSFALYTDKSQGLERAAGWGGHCSHNSQTRVLLPCHSAALNHPMQLIGPPPGRSGLAEESAPF